METPMKVIPRMMHRSIATRARWLGAAVVAAVFALHCGGGADAAPPQRQAAVPAGEGHTITVDVRELRNHDGAVLGLLFDSSTGFPGKPDRARARARTSDLANGKATLSFPDVPAGTYAIAVIHDENGNNELDTNFIGMPKEGVGASNEAQGSMGPPRWKDAKFEVGGPTDTAVLLQYL